MRDPDFTLSAGPVAATPRVLAALGSPIVYHYDPAFIERFRATERKLKDVFLTKNDVLLMQGEAVLGLEAAARGLVQPGTKVLNLVQGVFGKGMGYWLKDFGAELHEVEVAYNDAVDPADVERYLDEHPGIELVTVVHSETPSGTLVRHRRDRTDRAPARRADARRLRLVDRGHAARGRRVAPRRLCRRRAEVPRRASRHVADDGERRGLGAHSREPGAPRASYLSMLDWKEQWIDGEKFPFTPSVSDIYGVEAAPTSCSRRAWRTRSRGTSARRRRAAPACARWASSSGRAATRSRRRA